ncbi:MAG: hypothetical protein ACI9YE_000453 [Psychroserpens sp.]|jgi:hypothetical protein
MGDFLIGFLLGCTIFFLMRCPSPFGWDREYHPFKTDYLKYYVEEVNKPIRFMMDRSIALEKQQTAKAEAEAILADPKINNIHYS